MPKSARLLIAAFCAVTVIVLGISRLGQRENPATLPSLLTQATHLQTALPSAIPEISLTQTTEVKVNRTSRSGLELTQVGAISAFRQWAEAASVSGFSRVDQTKGLELAKARAMAMKALIQRDPASALREALPTKLQSSLPPQIAAAIEQPVQATGICSVQTMCNHSPDASHSSCETTPVLLEVVTSWDAHYGTLPWQSYLGKDVRFDGIAVGQDLAVRGITQIPNIKNR